ncbi:MAG: PKD domain-containing protein [Methanoregula sp.]|nr:PKD domain-containing protein [Methanoregula sp.]
MSEEVHEGQPVMTKKQLTRAEKQVEHIERIKRTLIACLLGVFTGILSYVSGGVPNSHGLQNNGLLAFMLMLAGIVLQKHIFMLLGMDTSKLGAKDWFYQGFMTFALWFMVWTILLSSSLPVADFSANITSATAPVAVAFTDTSTGSPISWIWDLGDETNSTVQNPVYTYTNPGKYNVSLKVTNVHGNNSKSKTDYIVVAQKIPY